MNWVDLILILIFIVSIVTSIQRGLIYAGLDLCCWAGSLILAFLLNRPLGTFINEHMKDLGPLTMPLSFILVMISSRILLEVLKEKLLNKIPEKTHHQKLNMILGVIPGIIYGFMWVLVTATLLLLLPITNDAAQNGRESKLSQWTINNARWFEDEAAPVFIDLLQQLQKEKAAVSKTETITLPFKVKNPKRRPDLEAEMLKLVNAERKKKNLKPLIADPAIAVPAVKHSADMFARGYFSHITPEGKTPFERMKAEKIGFLTAGENLALAPTLATAHRGLMNSPGHWANILHPAFGRLGIGILDGGAYGLMVTQNFRN